MPTRSWSTTALWRAEDARITGIERKRIALLVAHDVNLFAFHLPLDEHPEVGIDAYVSGEISEHTVHLARESGVAFVCAGHHATERYGVAALGEHLAGRFGLEHRFVGSPNPV